MNAWGKVNPTPRDSANPTKGRGRFLLNITGIRLLQSQFLTQEKISRKKEVRRGGGPPDLARKGVRTYLII